MNILSKVALYRKTIPVCKSPHEQFLSVSSTYVEHKALLRVLRVVGLCGATFVHIVYVTNFSLFPSSSFIDLVLNSMTFGLRLKTCDRVCNDEGNR